jgi:hypothetical protein
LKKKRIREDKVVKNVTSIIGLLTLIFALAISADSWADLTGNITYGGGGLYATGDHWASSGDTLSWVVSQNGNVYSYNYTLTLTDPNAHDISHVIIGVSTNFTQSDILTGTTGFAGGGGLGVYNSTSNGNSNDGMPGTMTGIEWGVSNGSTFSWTLVTDRVPTMGTPDSNFYARDGSGAYAYSGTSSGFGNNVMVPDSVSSTGGGGATPIPAPVWLLGSGLAGLAGIRKKVGLKIL